MKNERELVICSLIWALTTEMLTDYDGKGVLSLHNIQRITGCVFKKLTESEIDQIEEKKVAVWLKLAQIYKNEVVVSLPQVVEMLSWEVEDYMMAQDKSFVRWIDSMIMKVSYGTSSIKDSNDVADKFVKVLNESLKTT